jgi:ATP-binding cassette subfamily B protein
LIFLLQVLATPLALLMPLPLKIGVDSVLGSDPLPDFLTPFVPHFVLVSSLSLLVFAAGLQIGIVVLSQLQSLTTKTLISWAGEPLILDFRARIFRRIQRLSLSFHDTRGTADSVYRVQYDAPAIKNLVISGAIPVISALFTIAGMIYVTVRINVELAFVALAVCPMLLLANSFYRVRARPLYKGVKKLESNALGVVQEAFGAARLVKAFSAEERVQKSFESCSNQGLYARVRVVFVEELFGLCVGVVVAAGTAAVLIIGIQAVQAGTMTLGEFLIVVSYMGQLLKPMQSLSRRIARLQSDLASAHRAFEVLDEAPDVPERADARALGRAHGSIEFRDVTFGYDANATTLENVAFKIAPGTSLGVVGPTGAGKSTLASLICRFYDPDKGQILLDGEDLRHYRLLDLRNQFAIVLQDPVLFSTTIAENIAQGDPEASEAQIIEAARAAGAHGFITDLADGYQSYVGERGLKLSGGERQRISLARAFLKDAPILILDEPTSSVDVKTEAGVVEAMERLIQGRTTIVIAHRLSTLRVCDKILVLENGGSAAVTSDVRSIIENGNDGLAQRGLANA